MATFPRPPGAHPADVTAWWRTSLTAVAPGSIRIRGYAIEELIGRVDYASMVWLVLRGELPTPEESALLGAALVAAVDHGPQAPAAAIARMAATCGVGVNNAIASGVNVLGDVHGGAGEGCMELLAEVARVVDSGRAVEVAVDEVLRDRAGARDERVPGFGHRFHPVDPRAPRLMALVRAGAEAGWLSGRFSSIGAAVEAALERAKGRRIPMNVDGATAVVFSELGFAPALGRGLFVLSRSVGILAHVWEQMQQGGRIKGPLPPEVPYRYDGPGPRPLPGGAAR